MNEIQKLELEIEVISSEISSLISKREPLQRRLEDLKSEEFIRVNKITKDQVESPDGHGEWFGTVWRFGDWLKSHSSKPWAVWNGRIYRSSDLKDGRMPESPALESSLS